MYLDVELGLALIEAGDAVCLNLFVCKAMWSQKKYTKSNSLAGSSYLYVFVF